MSAIEKVKTKHYTAKIYQEEFDNDMFNPRVNNDNLGTIATWHRNYALGDEQPEKDPINYMIALIHKFYSAIYNRVDWYEDRNLNTDEMIHKTFYKYYIALPVYMYDHSGISISTDSFSCPWDSGKLGFIYVSKEKVKSEFNWKKISKKRKKQIEKCLDGEISEYNSFLNGEIYYYKIKDKHGHILDSCGGYLGCDCIKDLVKDCELMLDHYEGQRIIEKMKHSRATENSNIEQFTRLYNNA